MDNNLIKILLIEDNPGDVRLLKETLSEVSSSTFDIAHAARLSTGLKYLTKGGFDIVLLDLSLPDGEGLDTVIKVRNEKPEIPIVILTGFNDESVALQAVQVGAQDYLVKGSIDRDLLVKAIRYALERNRLLTIIEEARQLERHIAYHDSLTGLANRHLFYDRLHHAVAQANRYSRQLAVLFLDLDGFKGVNDTLGHSAGDHLLQSVAQRLKKNVRESDSIARLGGDEFTIILDHITHMQDAAKVAQKIIKVFSKPFIIEEQELYVTCSIGISLYPFDGVDIKTLVKKADIAMYRSKGQGKNKYQFYNASMDVMIFESMSLENGLRTALDKEELVLHYQPQVKIETGTIVGVEALVRWQHPEFGLVYPAKFIPIAEETGLIAPLGDWVLRTACAQIKAWQDELFPAMRLAVNVSSRQFRRKKLPETVALVLEETNLKPDFLQLEITESKAIQNVENTIVALQLFKEIGVQLSFDDFGNGYTSLGYLKRFPIDILKIDPSFVQGIPFDNDDAAIITAIIVLAHSMGLKVIAEGVETKDQLSYLRSLQCDEMQGFYFSQPIPADSLKKLLHSKWQLTKNLAI